MKNFKHDATALQEKFWMSATMPISNRCWKRVHSVLLRVVQQHTCNFHRLSSRIFPNQEPPKPLHEPNLTLLLSPNPINNIAVYFDIVSPCVNSNQLLHVISAHLLSLKWESKTVWWCIRLHFVNPKIVNVVKLLNWTLCLRASSVLNFLRIFDNSYRGFFRP